LHALPVKEYQIIDILIPPRTTAGAPGERCLKDDVMQIHPVQKMTSAGQTNRFVCFCSLEVGCFVGLRQHGRLILDIQITRDSRS